MLTDDLLSPDMPASTGPFPLMPGNLAMNRSLENILLDTSPMDESIDLGSSEMIQTLDPLPSLPSSSSINEKLESHLDEGDPEASNLVGDITECEENKLEEVEDFEIDNVQETRKVSFEDIIAPVEVNISIVENTGEESIPESKKEEEEEEELLPVEDVISESFGKVSISEEIPVGFVEEKGMRAAESNRSLMKFFVDSSGGSDVEGKGFFDSFTADEPGNDLSSMPPTLQTSMEIEKTPSSLPPSVPPSPHIIIPQSNSTLPCPVGSPATKLPFFQVPSLSSGGAELEAEVRRHLSSEGISASGDITGPDLNLADAFISGMTDEDRRYDAWIPSEMTRQALVSILTSHSGAVTSLPSTQLSMPGVIAEEALGDPVRDLVQRYMGETEANKRLVLNADSVPQDKVGLCQLIKAGCLRSAVDLTCRLLVQVGQGPGALNHVTKHTSYTLQLWFCRLSLLMKLKLFTQAEAELEPFGNLDSPDLYYEYYQETFPMQRGSLVPFDMRILHAELPQYVGRPQDSLDRLCYMQAVVSKMLSNLDDGLAEDGSMLELGETSRKASKELWQKREARIYYSFGTCLLGMKDYGSAVTIFKKLMEKDADNLAELQSATGRIYLQMGDTDQAMHYFSLVEASSPVTSEAIKCRNLMNRGLVAMGNNQFSEAHQLFKEIVDIDKTNVMAINNMAVCSLYLGRLKESLGVLESLVYGDPARNLQEGILLNLSTLYELESSRALHKKQSLLNLVSEHCGNGFNVACLKMA